MNWIGEIRNSIVRAFGAGLVLAGAATLFAGTAMPAQAAEETLSESFRGSQRNNLEFQMVDPIVMFDNAVYVGPGYVSVWLIPTSDGLILVDASEEPYVEHILSNIRKVGYDPADIRYILISHGHLDHFGGVAYVQDAAPNARVGAMAQDWDLIAEAASRPGRNNGPSPRVPERDIVYKDGDTLTLGDTTLNIFHMPGHTPGVLSFAFTVYDHGTPHKAFFSGGSGGRGGVAGFTAGVETSGRMMAMTDIEVILPNHSWLSAASILPGGGIFERLPALEARGPGDPHPFIDPDGWRAWMANGHQNNLRGLEEARRAGTP